MVSPEEGGSAARGDGPRGGRGRGRSRGGNNRTGGQRRGRGGGGGGEGGSNQQGGRRGNGPSAVPADPAAQDVAAAAARARAEGGDGQAGSRDGAAKPLGVARIVPKLADDASELSEADVCFICANPVAHQSIAPCNHTTCHICGLRMRALYKTKDCAHCRTPAPFVIFTDDLQKRFEEYSDRDITTTDSNIGIKYTNEDIVGDTVLLLRYNCPDASCDFAGLGWPDLHRHVKSTHRKRMCDLCTRNKKVFTHEHELFSDKELEKHMRHGDDKPGAADQTGFKGHPLCGFCGERFYDDDRLYEHCRMKHERCFICDRRDSRHPHYYMDYNALEEHFKKDHYICTNGECLEKKFVVFESNMDLQAHQLSEHAGRTAGRDARVVDISGFDIRQSYQPERRGGRGGGGGGSSSNQRNGEGQGRERGGRGGRGRGRDPNGDMPPPLSSQPLRRDEMAFQRQMAIHSAQSVSNRTFGGQLTVPPGAAAAAVATSASQTAPSSPRNPPTTPRNAGGPAMARSASQTNLTDPMESLNLTDTSHLSAEERARLVRHGSVIERAANLLANDVGKMASFRQDVSAYRQGTYTAPQLIDAFFTLFADVSSNALGTLVREVADLFEDKTKADNLRKAWQNWRAINEDYPSLPGLSGMHGATSSSSGWGSAGAANPAVPTAAPSQRHSTRVLKLKNSTRLGGPSPTPQRTGPPGWTPASTSKSTSSAAFPSLPPAGAASSSSAGASSAASSQPSWIGSSSRSSRPSQFSQPSQSSQPRTATGRPREGGDAFPALPAAPKPTSTIFGYGSGRAVRRDYGHADSSFQWGTAGPSSSSADALPPVGDQGEDDAPGKGKKGGKNKKKQVLVQWG